MRGINLLPWREERRQLRDKQMLTTAILIWLVSCGVVLGGYQYLEILKKNQNNRNQYLTSEIEKLDTKIKEIRLLQNQKDSLIARMEVIQNLQRQRSQVVKIFDDIVRKLPDGVYFDTMNKKLRQFDFTGTAQSNARVSNLMESLGSSGWFHDPDLSVINIAPSSGVRLSQFKLGVSQRKKEETSEAEAENPEINNTQESS